MKLIVAYGRPGSGKTTKLKTLEGTYYDFDSPEKRKYVKEFIKVLDEGIYIVDFFLTNVNDFIEFFFENHPYSFLEIYQFETPVDICLTRDDGRREKSSENMIRNMKIENIIPRSNLTIHKEGI